MNKIVALQQDADFDVDMIFKLMGTNRIPAYIDRLLNTLEYTHSDVMHDEIVRKCNLLMDRYLDIQRRKR